MRHEFYKELAVKIDARRNCIANNNSDWEVKHTEHIGQLIDLLPHGSGIDGKTTIDYDKSKIDRIVICSEFHAMDDAGFYDRWISYKVTVSPSLICGINISIAGNFGKYGHIKDYLEELYYYDLYQIIEWDVVKHCYRRVSDGVTP